MSRVYFHTKARTVGIGGRQRATFGALCSKMTHGILDLADTPWPAEASAPFRRMLKPGHYAFDSKDDRTFAMRIRTLVSISDNCWRWNGHEVDMFGVTLNTALVLGSDVVKLAARIHGACELHTWVDGPNREWLAGLIERGLDEGLLIPRIEQPPHEWTDVIALLRERDDEPVVTSYSVCEQFPGPSIALGDDADDAKRDAFYEMDKAAAWDLAMAGLKAQDGGLELAPDNWQTFRFAHKLSALDLASEHWASRLDTAFPLSTKAVKP